LQAADGFLAQVIPQITATAAYREHGLIVITFAAPEETTEASATSSPAGTFTGTLTAAGSPAGALLLSPFLRHAGMRSTSDFDPAAPRQSLEGLVTVAAADSSSRHN
jgi:hypothetical protein